MIILGAYDRGIEKNIFGIFLRVGHSRWQIKVSVAYTLTLCKGGHCYDVEKGVFFPKTWIMGLEEH